MIYNISTDPLSPECLHYLHSRTGENVYTTAIKTVGEILQDYDYGSSYLTPLIILASSLHRQEDPRPRVRLSGWRGDPTLFSSE